MLGRQDGLSAAITTLIFKSFLFLFSFMKHIVIAGAIGLSVQLDIFYMAIAILGVLVSSWAHVFDYVAIPKMISLMKENKIKEMENLIGGFLSFTFILSIILCLLFLLFPQIVSYMAFGFGTEQKVELSNAFLWLIPAILFFLPLSFSGSILKASRKFIIFYIIEILASIIVLFCIYFFLDDLNVLYWSYSLSIVVPFLVVYFFINKSTKFWLKSPLNKQILYLLPAIPSLFLLHGSNYLFIFTDRFFVSFLDTGDMSALAYATTLILIIPSIVGVPYYFLTLYSDEENNSHKTRKVNDMMSLIIFFSVPSIIFFIYASDNFISILFERGEFTRKDTLRVFSILQILSIMVLPLLLQRAIDQIFQVEKKLIIIVKRTVLGLILNIILNYIAVFYLNLGVIGVALATSTSNIIILILSLINLNKLKIIIYWKRHLKWTLWILLCYSPIILFYILELNKYFQNILLLITIVILLIFSSLICCIFYRGYEKKLIGLVMNKILIV